MQALANSTQHYKTNHYEVNRDLRLDFNSERAEFFRVDIKDLTKMLDGAPSEKDELIMKLVQENQLLKEDNEVFRTLVTKANAKIYKLTKLLKKFTLA